MSQFYQKILVAVDGSIGAEIALTKAIQVAKRNHAKLLIAHVVDTRAIQNVATFDATVYENLEEEAKELLKTYKEQAQNAGLKDIELIVEFGNPKTLLAHDIPEQYGADLMLLGATGLNAFERLLIGSSSEYVMRHSHIDLLIVRNSEKTL